MAAAGTIGVGRGRSKRPKRYTESLQKNSKGKKIALVWG